MPLDALHLRFSARELNGTLGGGRIDKITATAADTVYFGVYAGGKNRNLIVSANPSGARCHLTGEKPQAPAAPTGFLLCLKRHTANGRITGVEAVRGERVLKILIEARNELGDLCGFTLIAELMGKHSNLILTDKNGKILESVKHIPPDISSKRQVLPGLIYMPAPAQNKADPENEPQLRAALDAFSGGSLTDYLIKSLSGLSPASISEAVYNASGDTMPADFVSNEAQKQRLIHEIDRLFAAGEFAPCVFRDADGNIGDFLLKPYRSLTGCFTPAGSLNEAMDAYYGASVKKNAFLTMSRRLTSCVKAAVSRAEKKLAVFLEQRQSAGDFEDDRLKGEILTANLYRVKQGDLFLIADNYYADPPAPLKITLDEKLTPGANAQRYYKRYQKKKKTFDAAAPQIEAVQKALEYLESVSASIDAAETTGDLDEISEELTGEGLLKTGANAKPKGKSPNRPERNLLSGIKRTEYEGYSILTGKNNMQNDALYKGAAPNDLWLHTKNIHGAHTVIVNPKKTLPPEPVIRYAAGVTALYSKASASENVPVDYTFIKFVSKPKGAAPGKVVYTNQKTIYVAPKK